MKKIYYGLMLAGALTLCTGCSSSLLDIDNPNEVTNDTYWNKPEDATAGVNAVIASSIRKALGCVGFLSAMI